MSRPAERNPNIAIEYLIRADDGRAWDLLIRDLDALVPRSLSTRVFEDDETLIVETKNLQVTYSAEDPGWRLVFSPGAVEVDAWSYATAVATQLAQRTGIAVSAHQISGFDGGIFHCDEAFGIKHRKLHVFAGKLVHGDIDVSMNVSVRLNSTTTMCLRIDGIEELRESTGRTRLALTRKCADIDELEFLLAFNVHDEYLEVSHRHCDD